MVQEGELLWSPSPERIKNARLDALPASGCKEHRGKVFEDYEALWRWSTTDLDGFWQSCWDYFGIEASKPPTAVLGKRTMPGTEWFPGAELNYARHMLRHERPNATARAAPE